MPILKNTRWERFAQGVASGQSASGAYRDARYVARGNAAEVNAIRLLRKAQVKRRVRELQAETAEKADLDRAEIIDYLARVIRTPIGALGPDSPLLQVYRKTANGVEVRMVDKLKAVDLLARICGWYDQEEQKPGSIVVTIGGDA